MKLNTPNKLTLLRVALVPVFMVFAACTHYGQGDFSPMMSLLAGIVFAGASFTDYLDGHLARKNHLTTDFGKFADPLADKMLTTAALIYMVLDGVCSPVVLAVILFREFAVAGVRMIAAGRGTVIAANLWGKVKTVLQMVTVLVFYFLAAFLGFWCPVGWQTWLALGIRILCWAVAVVTLISGVKYIWENRGCIQA